MKKLTRCPVCGGGLLVDRLMQYSLVSRVGKDGVEHRRAKRVDRGSMDCFAVVCEHGDFATDYELRVTTPAVNARVVQRDDAFYLDADAQTMKELTGHAY